VSSLSETIAKITFSSELRHIEDILFFRRGLRFKCKRCAVFCCKLGGPQLTEKDLEHLKNAGYRQVDSLALSSKEETKQRFGEKRVLKQREDGSCIFLQNNGEEAYRCGIYELRPALCRLYPFEFERTGLNTGVLRFIPCCNGLNARDGSLVDERFVEEELLEAILDLC
jgi:Fe-S-cluster containining protein